MTKKLFVYGSLMKDFFNYNKYLKGKVLRRSLAKTKGRLYHLVDKGYPALIDGDEDIYGELIEVEDFETTLKALDDLENYSENHTATNEYNRVIKEVELLENQEVVKAHVYQYNCQNKQAMNIKYIYLSHGNWRYYMEVNRQLSATS